MARILIADDHTDSREVLAAMLNNGGHNVVLAVDGKEAVALYRSERPDLALIDIFMPGMDGVDVIIELRREFPGAKLVAMSAGWTVPSRAAVGGGTFDPLLDADSFGADATLSKPLDTEQLFGVIDRVLDVNARG